MPSWDKENPPNHIPDEIPAPLDSGQRRQDALFDCQQLLRERGITSADMDTLAKQPDLALRVLAYLDIHEGALAAEAMLAVVQEADIWVNGESDFDGGGNTSDQFHFRVEGTSFGNTSRLRRKMSDEVD